MAEISRAGAQGWAIAPWAPLQNFGAMVVENLEGLVFASIQ
jgi:hypothetical protein